ncbi:S-layer protein [Lysinibacillus piscis]|uniref:S-layer protein n=1 Tax=Lysinibacillus piscis TaxID=2518931 RepID=A0ABQ5NPU2_9BACI|nr:S-layer protein [Lysinibacillus sp. KH24]GLC90138.1 hypothetical protein LYSBPC_32650 [Lysinibacillus sp. KH24]
MKNKALTTFMATAITATLVVPAPIASAASSDSVSNHVKQQIAAITPAGEAVTITNVTSDKVSTSNGQYRIGSAVKGLFSTDNRTALSNAQATIVVRGGEITSVTSLTLSKAGSNKKSVVFNGGAAKIAGTLTVNGDYTKVENVTVTGELIVSSRVKKAVTLENVTVEETITLKSLQLKKLDWLSVVLQDVKSSKVSVQRSKVRLTSDQTISSVTVLDKVINLDLYSNADKLVVDVEKDFSLYGEGKIEQITVKRGAKVALDSGHQVTKTQVDDSKASVTLPTANKEELAKLLASPPYVAVSTYGYEVSNTAKWTTQADRVIFDSIITSSRLILNNSKATQAQVNTAITQYKNALAAYQAVQKVGTKYGATDKNSLQALINSIQLVTVSVNGYELGNNVPWTTQAERNAIEAAITSARNVINNYYSTTNDIINASNSLNNAIQVYQNAKRNVSNGSNGYNTDRNALSVLINSVQYVAVSDNGYGLGYNVPWTTQAARNTIDIAVEYARNTVNNSASTATDIANASSYLNNAIQVYKTAQKNNTNGYYTDTTTLQQRITTAWAEYQNTYASPSGNGSEVIWGTPWVPQSYSTNLYNAIQYAQTVVNSSYTDYNAITQALNNLNNALSAFYNAKR